MEADSIELFGWYSLLSKPGFTAEPQRPLREISSAPIGRRRLEQKLHPFGNKIEPFYGYGTYCQPSNKRTEAFLFVGISRQTKNSFSASFAPLR
jgi:hypothetical protein